MKGVKYKVKMVLPKDEPKLEKENLTMKELCNLIETTFKEKYFFDEVKVNNQIIYNIMKRPKNCRLIFRNKLEICKC